MAPTKGTTKQVSAPVVKPKKDAKTRVSKSSKPPRDKDAIYFGNSFKPEPFRLSNFAWCKITDEDGATYRTAEHYYHAEKLRLVASYLDEGDTNKHVLAEKVQDIINAKGSKNAKDIASSVKDLSPANFVRDWDPTDENNVTVDDPCLRIQTMWKVLHAKFLTKDGAGVEARKYLLDKTGDKDLYEVAKECYFFGIGETELGKNMLGKMLMKLRTDLRSGAVLVKA